MYSYPTIQNVIQDTVILMKAVVDLGINDCYEIQYRKNGAVFTGYISHKTLLDRIDYGMIQVLCKSNVANGHPFIKIPIKYLSYDKNNMGQAEDVPKKLF